MADVLPLLEESIDVAASPQQVWQVVADLGRMSEWSPQVVKSVVTRRPIRVGTNVINVNRQGLVVWPTRSVVVRFEPHQEIAFQVKENTTIWSFTLTPNDQGGTTLTQRREAPDGVTSFGRGFIDRFLGGMDAFQQGLQAGMRETLTRIKATIEATPR